MRRLYKIINIALIFALIGALACQDVAYSSNLRVPFIGTKRAGEGLDLFRDEILEMIRSTMRHEIMQNYYGALLGSLGLLWQSLKRYPEALGVVDNIQNLWKKVEKSQDIMRNPNFRIEDVLLDGKDNIVPELALIYKEVSELVSREVFKKENAKVIIDDNDSIKRMKERLLSFIDVFSALDTNDINKLLRLFNENIFIVKCDELLLCKEKTSFDKSIDKEEFIILGIVNNLVRNASIAVVGCKKIIIKTSIESGKIKIEVSDDGRGITKEVLKKIFTQGFTTKDLKKGEEGGQGLYLTLKYLRLKGGKIQVDSVTTKDGALRLTFDDKLEKSKITKSDRTETGATFTMWLPPAPEETVTTSLIARYNLVGIFDYKRSQADIEGMDSNERVGIIGTETLLTREQALPLIKKGKALVGIDHASLDFINKVLVPTRATPFELSRPFLDAASRKHVVRMIGRTNEALIRKVLGIDTRLEASRFLPLIQKRKIRLIAAFDKERGEEPLGYGLLLPKKGEPKGVIFYRSYTRENSANTEVATSLIDYCQEKFDYIELYLNMDPDLKDVKSIRGGVHTMLTRRDFKPSVDKNMLVWKRPAVEAKEAREAFPISEKLTLVPPNSDL